MRALAMVMVLAAAVVASHGVSGQEHPAPATPQTPVETEQSDAAALPSQKGTEGPKGLRLRWWSVGGMIGHTPSVTEGYVTWRESGASISKRFTQRSDSGVAALDVMPYDNTNRDLSMAVSYFTGSYNGWHADFGPGAGRFQTSLYFYKDEFYGYNVDFQADSEFDLILSTLSDALGAPDSSESSTVQNRMGATFDNVVATWTRGDVSLKLEKRAANMDEGTLEVRYLPIADSIPAAPGGAAPF